MISEDQDDVAGEEVTNSEMELVTIFKQKC